VPGIFVRSQLLRIPADERKFNRRRIVAFLPVCTRERAVAASQTSATEGTPAIGVPVDSITGESVGEGRGAGVSEGATVGGGVFVPIADGIEFAASVSVMDSKVTCGEDVAEAVPGMEDIVPVEAGGVNVGASDCGMVVRGACLQNRSKKRISRRIATINLKRS